MSREVVVICDGTCGVEMLLDLKPGKAEGGFYGEDIAYELRDSGWTTLDGRDLCDQCSPAKP